MPTIEHNSLVFRFPEMQADASFSIDFQRTLRIPDTDNTYPLPPGLGRFPLRHAEDFAGRLTKDMSRRGGVVMPMWQAEALWLRFDSHSVDWRYPIPVAIKVAAGKINAVTGKPWLPRLSRRPQDYMVSPEQPWLDGFAVEKGVIRQFVAMPFGQGYSVEEQLTGKAEWGGLQILVMPLKPEAWHDYLTRFEREDGRMDRVSKCMSMEPPSAMGLGAGGRMHQSIARDPFGVDAWNQDAAQRVFVSLINGCDWEAITGERPPTQPPTAETYSAAGLPWFEYYGADHDAVAGGKILAGVSSVGKLYQSAQGVLLPDSGDVETGPPIKLA